MKKRLSGSSESIAIIKIILILTLIFGFNDNAEKFIFSNWIVNLFLIFCVVALVVLIYILGLKLAAKYQGTKLEIKIWNSHKFKDALTFGKKALLVYSTPILNVLVTILSNGKIFLASVMSFDTDMNVVGKRYQYLNFFSISMIVFFGLLFSLILMWIFKLFEFDLGLKISFWFILFSLLPISELPGAKLLAGSVTFYVFNLIFFVVNIFLLQLTSSLAALFVSLMFSIVLATLYFVFFQYNRA